MLANFTGSGPSGGGGGGGGGGSGAVAAEASSSLVRTLCDQNLSTRDAIKQGPGTVMVAEVSCKLPDLGTLGHPSPANPRGAAVTLTLVAELPATGTANQWRARLYPKEEDDDDDDDAAQSSNGAATGAAAGVRVYTQAKFCSFVPVHSIQCSIPELSDAATVRAGSVFVVDYLDENILQWAARGVTVSPPSFIFDLLSS